MKNTLNGLFLYLKCFSSIINHLKHSTIHVNHSPINTLMTGSTRVPTHEGALIIYTHIHTHMYSIHRNLGLSVLPKDTSTGGLEEPRIELPISANSAFGLLQKLPGQRRDRSCLSNVFVLLSSQLDKEHQMRDKDGSYDKHSVLFTH